MSFQFSYERKNYGWFNREIIGETSISILTKSFCSVSSIWIMKKVNVNSIMIEISEMIYDIDIYQNQE